MTSTESITAAADQARTAERSVEVWKRGAKTHHRPGRSGGQDADHRPDRASHPVLRVRAAHRRPHPGPGRHVGGAGDLAVRCRPRAGRSGQPPCRPARRARCLLVRLTGLLSPIRRGRSRSPSGPPDRCVRPPVRRRRHRRRPPRMVGGQRLDHRPPTDAGFAQPAGPESPKNGKRGGSTW